MSIISRSLKSINIYKSTLKSILGEAKYFLVVYKYCYSYKYTCTRKCFQVRLFSTLLQLKRDSGEDKADVRRLGGTLLLCVHHKQYKSLHFQRDTVTGPGLTTFVQETRKHAVKSNKNRKQLCCSSVVLWLCSYSVYSHKADPVQASLPAQGERGSPPPAPRQQHHPVQQHRLPGPGLQQRLQAQSKALCPPMPFVSDLPLLQIFQLFRGSHGPGSPTQHSPQDRLSPGSGSTS